MRIPQATILTPVLVLLSLLPQPAASHDLDVLEGAVLAAPADPGAAYRLASAYRASGAVERGIEFFTAFHEEHDPNSMSLVWQGSLKALASSSDALDTEQRLNLLQDGLADMNQAVHKFPDNVKVLMVRGITISKFPGFLGMHARAIHDLNRVLTIGGLEPGVEEAVRTALARAYRQAGREKDAARVAPVGKTQK